MSKINIVGYINSMEDLDFEGVIDLVTAANKRGAKVKYIDSDDAGLLKNHLNVDDGILVVYNGGGTRDQYIDVVRALLHEIEHG